MQSIKVIDYGVFATFRRMAVLVCACLIMGCSSTGQLVGANSPVESLGAPQMIPTSLGRLAVWDTGEQGAGPAVVLWPSIFTDHVIYTALVEHWRGKRRVILIDGPGHGASEGPQTGFSMQACAQTMKQILDAKSIPSAVVGGTSWGGIVAAEFAILYPQMTQAVIMMNTPFFVTPGGPSLAERFIAWGASSILATDLFTGGVARSFFLPATRAAGGPIMAHFYSGLQQSDSQALSAAIRSVLLERQALVEFLPRIQAPSLVIAGLQDDMYPLPAQQDAVKQLRFGKLVTVDSKHISVVDKPDQVAKELDRFLDGLAAAKR